MSLPSAGKNPYESASFLAAIVNSSSDAIITKDLTGTITSWNAGAEKIFGYKAAEIIGQSGSKLFPPDRYDEEPGILARIRAGEQVEPYDTVRRHKDGRLLDISLTVSPIRDRNGTIIGASKIARDITAQKQAQERFRITLASIGDAVISTDANARVTFMNSIAEQLTGWSSAEATGRPIDQVFRIIQETSEEIIEPPTTTVLRENRIVGLANHTLLIAKDGSRHPIDDSAAPIHGAGEALAGVVLVFRDVTARRTADLAARRLAAIIENSDDAIIAKDLKGIITNWNAGAERIFGYTEAEMIGQSVTKLIPPNRLSEEPQILARLQRGERVDHFQSVRMRKDGSLINVSLTISPIRDSEGTIIGASKIARDITALHVAQEKLQQHAMDLERKVRERTAKLEETVAELETFSYSLSHDMRAPVRAIQSFAEIALTDFGDRAPEAREPLQKVINAAARMDRLIQDVLSFARLSRSEIKVAPLQLDRLINEIVQERPNLQEPATQVKIESPLLPVMGHDAAMTQILTNLLENAAKFVPPGTKPQILVYTERRGKCVRLCIRDNGIGIEPEAQRRLFALFQRLPTIERYQGTGIGLAIVRKAAERMDGSVGVDSLPGKGSTFWVELPAANS
jgi:PAS domain S-box-containing protein